MQFKNPANGYVEGVSGAWFWSLLFGSVYFASKGIWSHVLISFVTALATFGVSWFIYPFFAHEIVCNHYLRRGWIPVAFQVDQSGGGQWVEVAGNEQATSSIGVVVGTLTFAAFLVVVFSFLSAA